MSRTFVLCTLLCWPSGMGFCQLNIRIGITAAPSLTFPCSDISYMHLNEGLGYSFGASALFFFTDQFFVKTGINYVRKTFSFGGIQDTREILVNEDGVLIYDINDPGVIIDPSRIKMLEITEAFHSLAVPVVFKYKFSKEERGTFFISGGFEAGYIFSMKVYINSEDNDELVWSTEMNEWVGSITAGFGWYQPLSERFLLIINPGYSYDFHPDWNLADFNFQTVYVSVECYFH